MTLDFSEPHWGVVDFVLGESERCHFGQVRLVGNRVIIHEDEDERKSDDCCNSAVTILPLESIVAISIYSDKTALDTVAKKAEIRKLQQMYRTVQRFAEWDRDTTQ